MYFTNWGRNGRWKAHSSQYGKRLFSLVEYLSLQMQITGIFVSLIKLMSSATPPLSPLLIPSTSSIIRTILFFWPLNAIGEFVTISLTTLMRLPLIPSLTTEFDLFLESLALTSKQSYPSFALTSLAEVVFPIPGGPLIKIAFEFLLCNWECQLFNQSFSLLILAAFPTTSVSSFGWYLLTQSICCDVFPVWFAWRSIPTFELLIVFSGLGCFGLGASPVVGKTSEYLRMDMSPQLIQSKTWSHKCIR